ncbi:MAG: glycosyltransferase N-terminal domain-containing protein [Bacteriovoracaceae bacterium]
MLFKLYQILRICYYPFFVWIFPLFSSSLRKRLAFENRNKGDLLCRSFKQDRRRADVAFEISSEGELEQIKPVLMESLNSKMLVELVFSSESVERACVALARERAENLRILRMPLLGYFPGSAWRDPVAWLSAPKLCLCRYDFFPELMSYGSRREVEFILLAGSLKSYEKSEKNLFAKSYYQKIYQNFDKIIASTELDQSRFKEKFGLSAKTVRAFDFRPQSIDARLQAREGTLRHKFPQYDKFEAMLRPFAKRRRIVFGSFWERELKAFHSKGADPKTNFICLVPHKLDRGNIDKIKAGLQSLDPGAPVYEWSSNQRENQAVFESFQKNPGVVVLNLKGVLCELYASFGAAFVGGGHGISVHSLMEPFLAECLVYCGPKIHRSTEYDLIRENNPDRLRIVDRLENVFEYFKQDEDQELSSLNEFREFYINQGKPVLDWLGLNK